MDNKLFDQSIKLIVLFQKHHYEILQPRQTPRISIPGTQHFICGSVHNEQNLFRLGIRSSP